MKKIMVLIGGNTFHAKSIAFILNSIKETSAELHGIFFSDSLAPGSLYYPFPNDMATTEFPLAEEDIKEENKDLLNAKIKLFQDECFAGNITCKVSTSLSLEPLLELSSSADLLIADADADFPLFLLKDILLSANCPVFLVGANSPVVEKVILAYDGSETSRHAIERYRDIFPDFSHIQTFLVTINFSPFEKREHTKFINEWLPDHFPNLTIKLLKGDVKKELLDFLKLYPTNSLIVMGGFSRGAISRLFHSSLADTVLDKTKISLFTTHQ